MSIKGALGGLAAMKAAADNVGGGSDFGDESPFLTLKDGESVKIRVLQELDEAFVTYNKRRGQALAVYEHSKPNDFKKKAICTKDEEGKCYGCERYASNPQDDVIKKWKPKLRLYTNVIVRGTGDTPDKVKVLSQGFGGKSAGNAILEIGAEFEGVCGMDMKFSRKGSGMNDTEYTIFPLAAKAMSKADQEFEVIDLSKLIKSVAYADQAAFYGDDSEAADAEKDAW